MQLKHIPQEFSICQVFELSSVDFTQPYFFIGRTDEEISLVCSTDKVPDSAVKRDDGWRAFRIEGVLDFSLVGILAEISKLLAENEIGIFAVSTYNTDYILVKKKDYPRAVKVLARAGHTFA